MKRKGRGAETVLSLRAWTYTAGPWERFWAKLNGEGFPAAQGPTAAYYHIIPR
ncbi:hypothetical protein ElP_34070 [Tautonia plasticadhaerens]|uniref:Uncharacterized protein n=2 Tax=Tautonia plasticadhaerens TaxID=2527974 RepID=A0A518H3S2_9BACT|nr:hypothetical protein ElP_34070 [Tautonia plasticadhaerens]